MYQAYLVSLHFPSNAVIPRQGYVCPSLWNAGVEEPPNLKKNVCPKKNFFFGVWTLSSM